MAFTAPPLSLALMYPIDIPVGLQHIESQFCWCDPLIEIDDSGEESVLHRHVTWN
jgi:hypothetical protein